ncbi:Uncharacterised protein [Candidatus Burarchaeum australiense]|nr:Uncharacterised protein [Candidatus Burarchaeum australiense]
METYGVCAICGKSGKMFTCSLCGRSVCVNDYVAGVCRQCLAGKK